MDSFQEERASKRGRQAVFFTSVNPMDDGNCMEESPRDLTKQRIAPYKNTWERLQNTLFWCNLKLAQEKGLHFYQTRSHAVVLHNTLVAACIEKAVCMKTQDELYQKVRLTPKVNMIHKAKTQDHLGNQEMTHLDKAAMEMQAEAEHIKRAESFVQSEGDQQSQISLAQRRATKLRQF